MANIAIIPARGGSKRIPGKNYRNFCGKPILIYAIETALASGIFDSVMVSTDDDKIAELARKNGAEVPFMRSEAAASDSSTTYEVIHEVIGNYREKGLIFENTCCIYPTAVFLTVDHLIWALDTLKTKHIDCVFSVVRYSYPIQRALEIKDGKVRMLDEKHLKTRSQDLQPRFHDAGMFYFYKTDEYLKIKSVFRMQSAPVEISEMESQDIDNESDWQLAELKYRMMKS